MLWGTVVTSTLIPEWAIPCMLRWSVVSEKRAVDILLSSWKTAPCIPYLLLTHKTWALQHRARGSMYGWVPPSSRRDLPACTGSGTTAFSICRGCTATGPENQLPTSFKPRVSPLCPEIYPDRAWSPFSARRNLPLEPLGVPHVMDSMSR